MSDVYGHQHGDTAPSRAQQPADRTIEITVPKADEKVPHGTLAETVYNQVEQLTANGRATRDQAFEEIALHTGRKAGTLSANYYRHARRIGAVAPRGKLPTVIGRAEAGDVLAAAEVAMARINALVEEAHSLRDALELLTDNVAAVADKDETLKKMRQLLLDDKHEPTDAGNGARDFE